RDAIGSAWITDLSELKKLMPLVEDAGFQEKWREGKRANKRALPEVIEAQYAKRGLPISVSVDSMFDCQVKRLHEYKRQLLNVLHAVALYRRIRDDPQRSSTPRTILFSGKAAPGYAMAKLIIRLINAVGSVVNADPL